jgi:hypothetical protein
VAWSQPRAVVAEMPANEFAAAVRTLEDRLRDIKNTRARIDQLLATIRGTLADLEGQALFSEAFVVPPAPR